MKSYTDIEQSKKLAKILPIESADMWYHGHYSPFESERKYDDEPCPFHSVSPNLDKPCWSLVALLELMPLYIRTNEGDYNFSLVRGGAGAYTFSYIHALKEPWELGYHLYLTTHKDSVIDAAFEMVVLLKENNKI